MVGLLAPLLACVDPDEGPVPVDSADTADTGLPAPACPDQTAPGISLRTWSQAGPLPATGLHTFATDGGAPIWVASHSTGIWRAGDDLAWQSVLIGVTHTIAEMALRPGDPDHAFRSAGGNVERTRDGGETWEATTLGVVDGGEVNEVRALAVTPWAPDRVLAVQAQGETSVSEDDGETWTQVGRILRHEVPEGEDPFAVWGWRLLPEPTEGGRAIFGDGRSVSWSDDGMATWTPTLDAELGGYSLLRDPTDADHIVVAGSDGLHESWDGAESWTKRDIGGDGISGAWANDGSWLAIIGTSDVLVSEDGAATFTPFPHPFHNPEGATILDDGRILVTDHQGIWASEDRGETWVDVSDGLEDRGASVIATDPTCPARVIAGSRCGGGLYVSEDFGASWTAVHAFFHYVMGAEFDRAVPNRVYGVSDDRLMRSDDAGQSWTEILQRYHFHGFTLHPDDPDTLLIGSVGSGGAADADMSVYGSTDGGETWADSSTGLPETDASAHVLVRWPGVPDTVVLGTYKAGDYSHLSGQGVGIYRSVDGGATWAAAAIDAHDVAALAPLGTSVFAATDDGIWRSDDEGATWSRVQGPAGPMLAIRFGEPGSPAEDIGLALTEPGRVWKSADGGSTWSLTSTALPANPASTLAQIAISADGTVGFVTVFDSGVWRIGL